MSAKVMLLALGLASLALVRSKAEAAPEAKAEAAGDLDESQSQKSYGFGYGTKVADKHSVATGKTDRSLALYSPSIDMWGSTHKCNISTLFKRCPELIQSFNASL
jgi:hypothetical protein